MSLKACCYICEYYLLAKPDDLRFGHYCAPLSGMDFDLRKAPFIAQNLRAYHPDRDSAPHIRMFMPPPDFYCSCFKSS